MNQPTYHIYGRKSYAKPLTLIAQMVHPSETPLADAVIVEHGQQDWVELVAIPESEILWARTSETEA